MEEYVLFFLNFLPWCFVGKADRANFCKKRTGDARRGGVAPPAGEVLCINVAKNVPSVLKNLLEEFHLYRQSFGEESIGAYVLFYWWNANSYFKDVIWISLWLFILCKQIA